MMRSLIGILTLASWWVNAALPPIEVINLEASPSCGALNHEVNIDPNDGNTQCLRVYFVDFSLVSLPNTAISKNCHLKARLRIPANVQFHAREAIAEGVYNIVGEAFAGFLLSYQLPTVGGQSSWHEVFAANRQGDFTFASKMGEEEFTPCIGYDTEIDLLSDMHAFIDQRSSDSSVISLDETGKRLSWNWKVKPCEADLFNRPLLTYYSAPNGRRYKAVMTISGHRGYYHSEAGFTGELSNLRRSQAGRILEGEWVAQGIGGRFKFTVTDARTGQFTGMWWDTQGRKGSWNGSYE